MINRIHHFEVLDSFRGIAAVCVVLFHLHFINSITEINFVKNSYLFVDFFFILSGFVLSHSYNKQIDFNFKIFILKRSFRIFPLHIFMLCMFLTLEILKYIANTYFGVEINRPPFSGITALDEILPNLFLLQSWLPFANSFSFNVPSWSISVEYYMYIIFGITIFFKNNIKYFLWLTISVISLFSIIGEVSNFYNDVFRGLYSFFFGSLIYVIFTLSYKKVEKKKNNIYSTIESVLIFTIICLMNFDKSKTLEYVLIPIFMFTIYIFSFQKGCLSLFFRYSIFRFLGKLSYSIYLVHVFVIFSFYFILQIVESPHLIKVGSLLYVDFNSSFLNHFIIIVLYLIIILFSTLTYKFIEVKGQNLGRKIINKLKNQRKPSDSLIKNSPSPTKLLK